jgi:hypothetical protein
MDGVRTAEGGEGVTGAMIRARIRADGRLAGDLPALLGHRWRPTVAVVVGTLLWGFHCGGKSLTRGSVVSPLNGGSSTTESFFKMSASVIGCRSLSVAPTW